MSLCLLFSHNQVLAKHILQQSQSTLQIFILLLRNSIMVYYITFEHREGDYVAGANIAGFLKVADAMLSQGAV